VATRGRALHLRGQDGCEDGQARVRDTWPGRLHAYPPLLLGRLVVPAVGCQFVELLAYPQSRRLIDGVVLVEDVLQLVDASLPCRPWVGGTALIAEVS
jgi:hypothetical protein